jgi:endonuclease/exonuclease/phosphatase family metal-dependent hydrolase
MENLKIASFNVKDGKINSKGGIRTDGTDNALLASQIIEDFDLVGTQELTFNYLSRVAFNLDKRYCLYGNYRYGKVLKHMPYNESNSIITKEKVLSHETVWLPWLADNLGDLKTSITKLSIMPRIATIVIFETPDKKQNCMINTHLDYQVPSIQARQLEALKRVIFKYGKNYPIILTGDFNMGPQDPKFISFREDIKDLLKRVDINKPTWHGKNQETTVDHIFVPKTWQIEDAGIISSNQTSDHDIIYASVKKR